MRPTLNVLSSEMIRRILDEAMRIMGETGMEMQFRDGVSGKVLGECRDTEIGRKYAVDVNASAVGAAQTWANGYLSSFQAWTYAKDAFDKWSLLVAKRIAQLRAGQP